MTKTLQERIAELDNLANPSSKLLMNLKKISGEAYYLTTGEQKAAKKALEIIAELQKENKKLQEKLEATIKAYDQVTSPVLYDLDGNPVEIS